jgi:lipoprotein signal peptidase
MQRHWVAVFVPVAAAVVVDDQLTKAAAAHRGLVLHNPSYALGVLGGPAPWLILGTVAVMLAFFSLVVPRALAFGVPPAIPALIAGGMLGNLLDRVRFGSARDFIATPWAIVNLADIAVAVGLGAFVVALVVHQVRESLPRMVAGARRPDRDARAGR